MTGKVSMPVRLPMPMSSAMSKLHAGHTVISSAHNTRCEADKCAASPWVSSGTVIIGVAYDAVSGKRNATKQPGHIERSTGKKIKYNGFILYNIYFS